MGEPEGLKEGINITNGGLQLNQRYCDIQTDIRDDMLVQVDEEVALGLVDDGEDDIIDVKDNTIDVENNTIDVENNITNPMVHSSMTKQRNTVIHCDIDGR